MSEHFSACVRFLNSVKCRAFEVLRKLRPPKIKILKDLRPENEDPKPKTRKLRPENEDPLFSLILPLCDQRPFIFPNLVFDL